MRELDVMKTIVFAIDSNSAGGAERVISTLANYFSSTGRYKVIVVNSYNASNFYKLNSSINQINLSLDTNRRNSPIHRFIIKTNRGDFMCQKLIVATGGISFPALGVSDIGYQIAKKFGHKLIPIRPALCAIETKAFSSTLMGISLPVSICVGGEDIRDDMLFTHFGIGGPAVYRATVRDIDGQQITINMVPDCDIYEYLKESKHTNGKKTVTTILSQKLPARVAKWVCSNNDSQIANLRDSELKNIANRINHIVIPSSDIKYHNMASAEVVRGGVDTTDISSKTMESKLCTNLYFIGEVLDIAGDLGGFNLHWAWASGFTAGNAV